MVVPVTLTNDIKSAVDLSNQANDEDVKKQFANAIRLYRKSMESYLNAALLIRNTCAPFVERAQKLKEFASDVDQEVVCEGLPELRRFHNILLMAPLLPPWGTKATTVVAGKKICFNEDIVGIDPTKLVFSQIINDPKTKAASTILLHGPPGTAKTLLCKAITSKCPEKSVFLVDIPMYLKGCLAHDPVKMTKMLIRNYRKHNTGCLVLDFVDDLFVQDMSDVMKPLVTAVKGEIVALLKEIAEKKEYKDLIIATSSKPWTIEEDMKATFQAKINIPMPEEPDRLALLKGELAKVRAPTVPEGEVADCAKKTERYSRYQVMRIVRLAAARNFSNLEEIVMKEDADRADHITKADMDAMVAVIKPDLAEEDVSRHKEFITANPTAN
ncbi:vacuolar protein sorting-associated protein 4A-like [Ornithodoros turicata]|uniref:vacuolar protein sorting-associated protein 4A-like n=1 Tax=Ornithodoros turicata TaxID=34597 RepID=UPI00313883F2